MKKLAYIIFVLHFSFNFCYAQDYSDCKNETKNETDKIAIINDPKEIFGDDAEIISLTNDELILAECLFNKALNSKNMFNKYYKQIVPALNKNGEKEVWINCFCEFPPEPFSWRDEIIYIDDGGSCYMNIKINLSKKVYYDLFINGNG